MPRNHRHDRNANTAKFLHESTPDEGQLAADVDAAWEAWSVCVQNVDEHNATLLKAAFEAGYEAAQHARRRKG